MGNGTLAAPARAGAWVAFLVLAGLIAMHGLGTHGMVSSSHEPMSHSMQSHAHADDAAMLVPADPTAAMDHLADGCLVVLGLALALILGLGLLEGGAGRAPKVAVIATGVLRRARAPDPPDLLRLSICRC